MKKTLLIFLFLSVNISVIFAQTHRLDATINTFGMLLLIDDSYVIDVSLEYQVKQDVGLRVSMVRSHLPLNSDLDNPNLYSQTPGKMLILEPILYFRPKRKLDRWYIAGMVGMEKFNGPFRVFDFNTFKRFDTEGKYSRYHLGIGLGYKRIFNRFVLNLGVNFTKEFANNYSASLTKAIPNIDKSTIGIRGIRFNMGFGYRFEWDRSLFVRD